MGLQGVIGYPGPRGIKVLSTFAYLSIMNGRKMVERGDYILHHCGYMDEGKLLELKVCGCK